MTSILWFRQDCRLRDQPALVEAAGQGAVIPVYVLDDDGPHVRPIGEAQRWWLHHSLASLDADLRDKGSRLILRRGPAAKVLTDLADECGAETIHALRHYERWWREAEETLGDRLTLHDGNHLAQIEQVTTGSGQPFRVYSSFWKALQAHVPPPPPVPAPRTIAAPTKWPKSDKLDDWGLLPRRDWADGFAEVWTPGEGEAQKKLKRFAPKVGDYDAGRNMPSEDATSRLSPHLHHGEISAAAIWHAVEDKGDTEPFLREIAWRDFSHGLLLALPDYHEKNGRDRYDKLPWRTSAAAKRDLKAWQQGRTGYPIVDAGMRQLWQIGWIHNRVRMIVASFLTKHLLMDWREGERWFWDCLVDADQGNNSVNWQWVAGTGVDANMFSRIMAPIGQSEKFDAGDYIREWVPELRGVKGEAIHDPDEAGCRPDDYPEKIIDHREARARALAANKQV